MEIAGEPVAGGTGRGARDPAPVRPSETGTAPESLLLLRLRATAPPGTPELTVRVAIAARTFFKVRSVTEVVPLQGGPREAEADTEVDLSALAIAFLRPGGELVLHLTAEGCKDHEVRLVPAQARLDEASAAHVLEAEVSLQAIGTVRGRLVDRTGRAAKGGVAVLATSREVYGSDDVMAVVRTGPDGVFRMHADPGRLFWLQAVHEEHGTAGPLPVRFERGRGADVGDVRFGGRSIAGWVHGIPPYVPAEGMRVLLYYAGDAPGAQPFSLGPVIVVSHEGILEPSTRGATAGEAGAFRFDGLLDHAYSLYSQAFRRSCGVPGRRMTVPRVEPGVEDVVLQYEGPLLIAAIHGPDGPLDRARCAVQVEDWFRACSSGEDGHVTWELAAGKETVVLVSAKGYLSQSFSIPPLSQSDVIYREVILEPIPVEEQELRLNVSRAGQPVHYIGVEFYEEEETKPFRTENALSHDGSYSFALEQGRYRIQVREGEWENMVGFFLDVGLDVEVTLEEEVVRDVEFVEGGRLRVRIADYGGRSIDATCEITDPGGEPVPVTFMTIHPSTGIRHESRTNPHAGIVGRAVWAEVTPALREGDYFVHAAAQGLEDRSVQVEIATGRMAELEILLLEE